MKTIIIATLGIMFSLGLHAAETAAPAPVPPPVQPDTLAAAKPLVDVVFVLDSTSSMGGLIAGAKEKIWSIANGIIAGKPTPAVRIGLVSYRDRGDEYITRKFDLTDDIDTVQCGNYAETTPIWQEIAKLAEGSYVALAQTGGMTAMTTPHDAAIAKLSAAIGATSIAYGSVAQQNSVRAKNAAAAEAAPTVAASRAAYNSGTGGKAIQGRGELLADMTDGAADLKKLKADELPPEMRQMSDAERKDYLEKQQAKRAALNQQLAELVRKRTDFIGQERNRLAKEGGGDSFDLKVEQTVREQIKRNTRGKE